jgi:hypothetical protein
MLIINDVNYYYEELLYSDWGKCQEENPGHKTGYKDRDLKSQALDRAIRQRKIPGIRQSAGHIYFDKKE